MRYKVMQVHGTTLLNLKIEPEQEKNTQKQPTMFQT